jgi:phosphohistidine swiveling domain-containing protein
MARTVAIDAAECADRELAGAKAARLAQARAAGFPVPNSLVIPCAESAPILDRALRSTNNRSLHSCRFEVMSADPGSLADIVARVRPLGPTLAVRSSSPSEDDPRLAGAFTSFLGVAPEDVATAVLGVWSSALVDLSDPAEDSTAARMCAGELREFSSWPPTRMGVLIQPELAPSFAGTAELLPGDEVQVVATDGPAGPLMAGWVTGVTATVSASGSIEWRPALANVGEPAIRGAAALVRDIAAALGDNLVEWAFADGRIWLLQSRRVLRTPIQSARVAQPGGRSARDGPEIDHRLVLRAVRRTGDLAERWVLPWALASDGCVPADILPEARQAESPLALWEQLTDLSDKLTAQAWRVRHADLGRVVSGLDSLRRGDSAALTTELGALKSPEPALAQHCLELATWLMAHLLWQRLVRSADEFWALPADLGPVLRGDHVPSDLYQRSYRATLKWEPLLFSTVMAVGRQLEGLPASPGMGCGHVAMVDDPTVLAAAERGGLHPRSIIAAAQPLPRFAPLLMNAAGLVTHGGSEAAHLVEVARSLGVPTVFGCDLGGITKLQGGGYAAVDGAAGAVSVLSSREAAHKASDGP